MNRLIRDNNLLIDKSQIENSNKDVSDDVSFSKTADFNVSTKKRAKKKAKAKLFKPEVTFLDLQGRNNYLKKAKKFGNQFYSF
jgi:hypothetical protein